MKISGYHGEEIIHEGKNSIIIRATRDFDQLPIVLKVLNREFPSSEDIAKFYMEYQTLDQLDVEGVINVLGIEEFKNTLIMIQEDLNIDSLYHYLKKEKINTETALNIAIEIAKVLVDIHDNKIIHNGLCPHNILWNYKESIISVIDFSSSTELDEQESTSTLAVSNTMNEYMSPEKTGRINALTDTRSDLYSLGVILYELVTGEIPLKSETLHEVIYKKISVTPDSPYFISNKTPVVLSNIIMKLLKKEPKSRYQTASGLLYDLNICKNSLKRKNEISEFTLAQNDTSSVFKISNYFCGRHDQVSILNEAIIKSLSGHKRVVLVSGSPGIGKSALVNAIIPSVIAQQGYFIEAKYIQYQSMTPYFTIKQCLKMLNSYLKIEPWEDIVDLKVKLKRALSENGKVITNLVPEFEWLLGKQEKISDLNPTESRFRFEKTIAKFLKVVARKCHNIIWHIDDIQWADSASMKLLEMVIEDPEIKYILIIFSYRDTELSVESELLSTINNNTVSDVENLKLSPLNYQQLKEFIGNTFSAQGCSIDKLTSVILDKTKGNPFYAIQFLNKANDNNVFSFNKSSASWTWNIDRIVAMNVCDNIVEEISNRIVKLNDMDRTVIQAAALMDGQFNIRTLSMLCDQPYPKVITSLWALIHDEFMVCVGSTINTLYKTCGFISDYSALETLTVAKFSHDKILQAAYDSIPSDIIKQLHLAFARKLLAEISNKSLKNESIIIALHYNKAIDIIDDPEECIQVANINLTAGLASRDKGDFKLSCEFLEAALVIFKPAYTKSHSELQYTLLYEAAISQYIFGSFEKAVELADQLTTLDHKVIQRAESVKIKILSYLALGDILLAINIGRDFLKQLDISIPEINDNIGLISQFEAETKEHNNLIKQSGFSVRDLSNLAETDNSKIKNAMTILSELLVPSFFVSKNLMHLLSILQVNLAIKNGGNKSMALAYSWWGISLIYQEKFKQAFEFSTLAMKMSSSHEMMARVCTGNGICIDHYNRHLRHSVSILKAGAASAEQSNELTFATYCTAGYNRYAFYQGVDLCKVRSESNTCLLKIQKWNVGALYDCHIIMHYTYLSLLGVSPDKYILNESTELESDLLSRWKGYNNNLHISLYSIQKMMLHYTYGDYTSALKYAIMAEENKQGTMPSYDYTNIAFYYPLILLELLPAAAENQKELYWCTINGYLKTLRLWSKQSKSNFLHKYLLVLAEKSRVKGDYPRAMALYDEAITEASKNKFIQMEAMANELYGRCWQALGKEEYAMTHLHKSFCMYRRWGAKTKLNQLKEFYGQRVELSTLGSKEMNFKSEIDFWAILKSSRTISKISSFSELIKSVLSIMIEYTCAHNCFCILNNSEDMLSVSKLSINNDGEYDYLVSSEFLSKIEVESGEGSSVSYIPVPKTVINYVTRSKEILIVDDISKNNLFCSDEYFHSVDVMSVLCKPIVNKGEVVAVLYMESNLMAGVFTENQLDVIDALSLQISISVENTLLYSALERKVEDRTKELKQTMSQLVEAEKMSALGQLVAGVAHELNTPIGISMTSVTQLQEDVNNLKDDYSKEKMTKNSFVNYLDNTEELIDLLLRSMVRASNLIKIFKTADIEGDQDDKVDFNVLEFINSSVIGLGSVLDQGNYDVTIRCDESIFIFGYPMSFSLIVTSLISNSIIHGFKDSMEGEIVVDVSDRAESVLVIIEDNGCGMSEDVKDKIFDPFFTTNRSIGIGLGLHVLYNLVVKKFLGQVTCYSETGKGTRFAINFPKKLDKE